MRIKKSIFVLIISCSCFAVFPSYGQNTSHEDLADYITLALENNPRIKTAYSDWKAAEYKARYVRGLPDPEMSYTYFIEPVETRVGPQKDKYGASQKIPFPGKLSTKGKAQLKEAQRMKEEFEAIKREIIKEVKFAYFDLYWLDRAIEITEQEKRIVESMEKTAERKFETNQVSQQDVVRAQLELSRLLDRLLMFKQNRKAIQAKMNSLLDRSQGEEISVGKDVIPSYFGFSLEELRKMALASKQELLAARLAVEKAQFEKSLACLDYYPDFKVGFEYIDVGSGHTSAYNDGKDSYMATVVLSMPLWFDKLNAQVDEKKELLEARMKDVKNMENTVLFEVEDLFYKILTYRDIVALYKSALIPQSRQAMETTRVGYEADKSEFIDWLDSERVFLQTRLAYHKSIVDYMKSIAFLERIVGEDLKSEGERA